MSSVISATQLEKQLPDPKLIILDCRYNLANPNEGIVLYSSGHIPKAQFIHPDTDLSSKVIPGETGRHPFPSEQQLQALVEKIGLNPDSQVVCYDASNGAIAVRAWWTLKYCGFDNVSVLDGGYPAWCNITNQVSRDIPPVAAGHFTIKPRTDWLIEADSLNDQLENHCILDARANDRYQGKNETIDPVAGHIPTALSAPFAFNIDDQGFFLPPGQLRQRFQKLANEKPVVHYCGSGITACHNWFAMHEAGLNPGKLYSGSWSHWITNPTRPIER